MGTNSSKNESSVNSVFSESEYKHLKGVFSQLCRGDASQTFTNDHLKEYLRQCLPVDTTDRLYMYIKSASHDQSVAGRQKKQTKHSSNVTAEEYFAALVNILKGDVEQRAALLVRLSSDHEDSTLTSELQHVLEIILHLHNRSMSDTENYASWKLQPDFNNASLIRHLLHDLAGKTPSDNTKTACHTTYDVELWLRRQPLLQHLVHSAVHGCFQMQNISNLPSLVPRCKFADKRVKVSTVLDLASAVFLNSSLPHELRDEWRFLFSSTVHGESFSAFLRSILNRGPTLLIVKDKDGHVFGGFASQSWALCSQFFGTSHCFLFSLVPTMDVYLPSCYNSNFMWLNQNQQTLPNGLGMGGQFEYFGLWIDSEYGTGHSKAQPKCTTYNSPQLSGHPRFDIDILEVWAVGPEKKLQDDETDDASPEKKKGFLNMDLETKAILEMIGKGNLSDGIVEEDNRIKGPSDSEK